MITANILESTRNNYAKYPREVREFIEKSTRNDLIINKPKYQGKYVEWFIINYPKYLGKYEEWFDN